MVSDEAQDPKLYDRGGLYYPYIYIRDHEWLKATLLCFPYIERMVPRTTTYPLNDEHPYLLNDEPILRYFSQAESRLPGIKMLGRRDLNHPFVQDAQSIIAEKIKNDLKADEHGFLARFSHDSLYFDNRYERGSNTFQIHSSKLL